MLRETIQQLAERYTDEFIAIRHHLHAHPELSYQEHQTSAFVREKLESWDIPYTVMAGTGVVGLVEGKNPSSRIMALRGDMDALPITEANEVPYVSTNTGVMHACGHDVHTTCLLGAARILQETRDKWEGTVKLIFQPGEEKNPGGASLMIKDGALDNPRPQGIIALHVHPSLETGHLSFRPGMVMASADEIYITIRGKGGHAATPHLTTDTILVASHLVVALQQIISRNRNPFSPSVLSICSINGGHTTNVIPSEVKLMGTFRAMDEEWRFNAHELIRREATGLVQSMGAELDLHIDVGYPVLYNQEAFTKRNRSLAADYLGSSNVEVTELRMASEDFAYYTHQIPGCFFRLGTRNEALGLTSGVHTPTFNIDERAIPIGIGAMAFLGATATV
ncbi:MAG TPA: M20 family metallopeptidase [Dinghuibacter sp.]|uniref:M20 metallopeptidase family protein n=1 Tax=Dinghuibacter sp. TaxID=2024697 RepID=UPI002C5A9AC2|nr:M20 family metallopeptidase [Dinghuibacter sp.]HTJ12446.1 M20 family metallopeptidase [Dinghuibacter sp.]